MVSMTTLTSLSGDPLQSWIFRQIRICIADDWMKHTASDGKIVDLPPSLIDIFASTKFLPEARAALDHLKGNLQAGDAIIVPSIGQLPKNFGLYGQGHKLFVTEQMLELWDEMHCDQEFTYRRILSGPMGVGKSHLSYFLAARAYAERWLVFYISDAGELDKDTQEEAVLQVIKRFLALNKDILTGAELERLANDYNGIYNIVSNALSVIFYPLLKSRDQKTLLLVDEHGMLFEKEPYVPDKFKSLVPLSSYHWWGEDAKGSRVVFTDISHDKCEMTILDDCYRYRSNVFSKLPGTYPRLAAPVIREEVTAITNRVPRELVYLSANVAHILDLISLDDLQHCRQFMKEGIYRDLLRTFFVSTNESHFDGDFMDLGLTYRSKVIGQIKTHNDIICRLAQKALLELFATLPLLEGNKRRLYDISLGGDQFKTTLCHQFICTTKPIVLDTTDLKGGNSNTISLDFSLCETLQVGKDSLGSCHENVLTRSYEGYPRFDFILRPMFIQVSHRDFGQHNMGSANLSMAFDDRDNKGTNQIERHLNDMYRDLANKLPDVRHIKLEELTKNLFKNPV
ncbi:hypothetical protein BGX30_014154 [Mortierella sp. GBA39]|nr:hypothetical protein BGX30_014154 [Mortierella sp. GBA39]